MSKRALTAAMESEVSNDTLSPFYAVYADFPSGAVRTWTGVGDLSFGGNTYTGTGELLKIERIEETIDTAARGMLLELSGIPSEILDPVLLDGYHGRTCELYLGCLDLTTGAVIADPYLQFRGHLDSDEVEDNPPDDVTIRMRVEHRNANLLVPRSYRYDEESQHALTGDATDRFFQFMPAMVDVRIERVDR